MTFNRAVGVINNWIFKSTMYRSTLDLEFTKHAWTIHHGTDIQGLTASEIIYSGIHRKNHIISYDIMKELKGLGEEPGSSKFCQFFFLGICVVHTETRHAIETSVQYRLASEG